MIKISLKYFERKIKIPLKIIFIKNNYVYINILDHPPQPRHQCECHRDIGTYQTKKSLVNNLPILISLGTEQISLI